MNYSYNNEKIQIDWITVVLYILFVLFGAVNIYSANSGPEFTSPFNLTHEYGKQLLWIAIAAVIVFFILLTDHKFFNFSAYGIYAVIIMMLLVLLATAAINKGAQAWFKIGAFKLQPSEFAKFASALALAKFFGTFEVKFEGTKNITIAMAIFMIPMALTLLQNDTGSALVFGSFFLVLFREGLSGWWLMLGVYMVIIFVFTIIFPSLYLIIGLILIAAALIFYFKKIKQLIVLISVITLISIMYVFSVDFIFSKILKPHQQQRILVTLNQDVEGYYAKKSKEFSFFKIEKKPVEKGKQKRDYSYNVRQSKISIGAGQWFGNGFNKGTQTKAKLVPEQHTDFIFCTVGEEYGFLGSSLFVILYLFFIGRLYYLAERQKNTFSRVYGYCTASIFFFHFFVNVGMALGLLPVIGIPLPFMSYGGSSLFSFSILLFVFLKLDANRVNEISRFN